MTSLLQSSKRTFLLFALVAMCFQSALAHTYLSSIFLNNQALTEGDCVRSHPATAYDSPIPLVTAADMTCGWLPQAAAPANRKCPIAAGSSIGLQWHHQSTLATDNIIDPTHVGPIMVYLAKSDSGAGNVWFKIYEDGYTNGVWAVTKLISNGGRVDIQIPADIAPGNYLLRGEILALHGAYAVNGVQPYVGCVELTISGSGSATPAGVAFPGYYTNTDAGMIFDVYSAFTSYPIPGPAVYKSSSSIASSSGSSTPKPTSTPSVAPTATPTAAPSTAPTSAPSKPTTTPTSAPTAVPTDAPVATPTSAPTSAPAVGNIKVGLNGGTNTWWVGVVVSGGGETTVKVEIMDSGSLNAWSTLVDNSYAFVFSRSIQVTAPVSVRLTSSSGKQVILTNVFTSVAPSGLIDSGKSYSSSSAPSTAAPTTKPTSAPPTGPTTKPTTAPTTAPTASPTSAANPTTSPSGNTKITIHEGSSAWWFAVTVSGNAAAIATVEIKDSGSFTSFSPMVNSQWAYTFSPQGKALVAPVTVRVTSVEGKVASTTITSITAGNIQETNSQL